VALLLRQKSFTSSGNIGKSSLKVAGIPRIRDVSGSTCILHHKMNFALWIIGNNPLDETQVAAVHTDDIIESIIVGSTYLTSSLFRVKIHAVGHQAAFCRRIDVVSDLLCTDRCGLDIVLIRKATGGNEGLQDELPHRASADVAVTNKKNFSHIKSGAVLVALLLRQMIAIRVVALEAKGLIESIGGGATWI